jgi:peptide methionine sulfoxide reductase MsrB
MKMDLRFHPECSWPSMSRFCDQNRIAIDPDLFLIAIMIAIAVSKSLIDFKM